MAVIIELENRRNDVVRTVEELPSNWTAEIIIFPGIRIVREDLKQQKSEVFKG